VEDDGVCFVDVVGICVWRLCVEETIVNANFEHGYDGRTSFQIILNLGERSRIVRD